MRTNAMTQDIFLKFSGIQGESKDVTHFGQIEVLTWEWSVVQESDLHCGSGGGIGKCTVGDLTFEHYVDCTSPNLMHRCLTGRPIENAVLVARKAGGIPLEYLRISLEEVLITAVRPTANYNMSAPREEVSLSFARVWQEYVIQNAQGGSGGTVSIGYDIKGNKEI
jgi:type VI secretion system secreted protein Hcp